MINEDDEHLNLLATFHYVVGVIAGLFSLFPVIHLVVGIAMITGGWAGMESDPPEAALFGWLFVAIAVAIIAGGLTVSVLIIMAGKNLKRRTRHTFCVVIAAIECAFMPFGTVLGVFTIIVLQRPSVKQLFGRA